MPGAKPVAFDMFVSGLTDDDLIDPETQVEALAFIHNV